MYLNWVTSWSLHVEVYYPLSYVLYTGIISAIAFSPTHNGMLATGSYSQTSAIYREDNMELLYVLHGQEGGITHVSEYSSLCTWFWLLSPEQWQKNYFLSRSSSLEMEIIFTLEVERYYPHSSSLCRTNVTKKDLTSNSLLPTFGLGRRGLSWKYNFFLRLFYQFYMIK